MEKKGFKLAVTIVMFMCQIFSGVVQPAIVSAEVVPVGQAGGSPVMESGVKAFVPASEAVRVPETVPLSDPGLVKANTEPKQPATPLTPEEQENYLLIFGIKPVTVKAILLDGGMTLYFYDQAGNQVGTMHKTTGTQVEQAAHFFDKDGKEIDLAELFNKDTVTAKAAAAVLKSLDQVTANAVLKAMNPEKADAVRQELVNLNMPVKPGDKATAQEWTKYFKDMIAYLQGITDPAMRKIAWEKLGQELYDLSKSNPGKITAGTLNLVMSSLTAELKTKYRDSTYTLDVSKAQGLIVDAALNVVKSEAFEKLTDAQKISVNQHFMALGIELSWRSANNSLYSGSYAKISEFFRSQFDNKELSDSYKAYAFQQLMHLYRTSSWASKEGNKVEADKILKDALPTGGLRAMVDTWLADLYNGGLTDQQQDYICTALAQVVWMQDHLNAQAGTDKQVTEGQFTSINKELIKFIDGVNSGKISVTDQERRRGIIRTVGSALNTMINKGQYSEGSQAQELGDGFIEFAKTTLASLDDQQKALADKGTLTAAQKESFLYWKSSLLQQVMSLKATAANGLKKAGNENNAALKTLVNEQCPDVLIRNSGFDFEQYKADSNAVINSTKNADLAALLSNTLAGIEKLNLAYDQANPNEKPTVTTQDIKDTAKTIKQWLSDPDHINDVRHLADLAAIYRQFGGLLEQAFAKGSKMSAELAADKEFLADVKAIMTKFDSLKDSKVIEAAGKALFSLVSHLEAAGFKEIAGMLEIMKRTQV